MTDQTSKVVLTADVSGYQQGMQQSIQSTNALAVAVASLNQKISSMTKSGGRKLEIVGAGQIASLVGMTAAAARLESQLSTLNARSVMTGQNFGRIASQVDQVRRSFSVSTDTVVALATQLGKLGQSSGNIKSLSDSLIRLSAVTGENITGLTDGLISLQRQMGTLGADSTKRMASALATVSSSSGVAAQSVLDFSNAIAPIGRVAGLTQQQLLGFSTAFVKSGQDGYVAANAFNKILTDITRSIQYGSPELKQYANLLGVTTKQFAAMDKGEAFTQIIETINQQGPDAIKTLEQLGLDGVRTAKAIQGLSQSGGIRSAVSDAVAGYSDTTKFQKASDTAMSGLNDSIGKLKNNLLSLAQSIGATFLPMATKFVDGLNVIVGAINKVIQPVAGLVAALGGLGAIGSVVLGGLIANFTRLTVVATAVSMLRSLPVRGFLNARNIAGGGAGNAEGATYAAGGGSPTQRALFGFGNRVGAAAYAFKNQLGMASGGTGMSMMQRLSNLGGWGVQQIGEFARYGLEPLFPGALQNSFNRSSPIGQGLSRMGAGAQTFGGTYAASRYNGSGIFESLRTSASAANAQMKLLAGSTATQHGLFRTMATEAGKFSWALTKAGAGLTGGVGMGVGRLAGRGLARAGAGAVNFLGGPIGLGLAVGGGIMAMHNLNESNFSDIATSDGTRAAGAAYRTALGEAAAATTTYADIVRAQAQKMNGGTGGAASYTSSVTASDMTAAQGLNKYTDPSIAGLANPAAARAYVQQAGNLSPGAKQMLKIDLLKRFGDAKTVESIMGASGGSVDLGQSYSSIMGAQPWYSQISGIGLGGAKDVATQVGDTGKQYLAQLQGTSPQDANRYMVATLNSAINAAGGTLGNQSGREAQAAALASTLGIQESDTASMNYLRDMLNRQEIWGSPSGAREQILKDKGKNSAATMLAQAIAGTSGNALNATTFTPSAAAIATTQSFYQKIGVGGTSAGRIALGTGSTASLVNTAVNQQGNANAQFNAAQSFAASMQMAAGSTTAAMQALEEMKSRIDNVNDPLYQLAQSAQSVVASNQARSLVGASSVTKAGLTMGALNNALGTPDSVNRPAQIQQAISDADQFQQDFGQKIMNLALQQREFGITQTRAQQDFSLSRARSEQDYGISRMRSLRDYNRSQKQSLYDFNLSRKRQEADFNHSVVVMAKEAAKSVYDVYQRVTVQQSWSAPNLLSNLQDQQKRLSDQAANLSKLRKTGISGGVIQLLGLDETANSQQLARFVQDILSDPKLVKQYNDMAKQRVDSATKVVTDQDSLQWQEMQRSFKLSTSRAMEDFNTSVSRQNQAFSISMADMASDFAKSLDRATVDFNKSMQRSKDDMNRLSTEITGDFNTIAQGAISQLTGQARQQAQALYDIFIEMQKKIPGLVASVNSSINSMNVDPTMTGHHDSTGTNAGMSANQKLGQKLAMAYGWGSGKEWTSLINLWNGESGWNNTAQNPTSTAYGIAQFLDTTWSYVGAKKTSDPTGQISAGLKYIRKRWGDPANAWSHWNSVSPHWYAQGGVFDGAQVIGVGEKGKETVLPLNQTGVDFLIAVMRQYSMTDKGMGMGMPSQTVHQSIDCSNRFQGPITVQAQDPDSMAKKLEARARRERLVKR